jgi:uncharacterized membrane protein YfcA
VAISAASALTASIAHWRGGRIDWRLFWLMTPPSLLGGLVGLILGTLRLPAMVRWLGTAPKATVGTHAGIPGRRRHLARLQAIPG